MASYTGADPILLSADVASVAALVGKLLRFSVVTGTVVSSAATMLLSTVVAGAAVVPVIDTALSSPSGDTPDVVIGAIVPVVGIVLSAAIGDISTTPAPVLGASLVVKW